VRRDERQREARKRGRELNSVSWFIDSELHTGLRWAVKMYNGPGLLIEAGKDRPLKRPIFVNKFSRMNDFLAWLAHGRSDASPHPYAHA
jgi:hypothetical protein